MDELENLQERANLRIRAEQDVNVQEGIIELCQRDIAYFFNYWLFTYDPRVKPADIPFILYDYQVTQVEAYNSDIEKGENSLTEKTRDMGATWMILGVFLYRWLFKDENFLLGSKKEEDVDKIGNMKAHFQRLRYMLEKLPNWMVSRLGWDRKNEAYMRIWKPTGPSLVGESMNSNFSRQGRFNAILLDEFAFVDSPATIWRSCGDASPCKLVISTPNGAHNFFYQLRKQMHGKIKIYSLHWKLHPKKDEAWYEKECENRSPKDIAQELDINYTISAGDPFYSGFSRALHLRKMRINQSRELILSWDYGFRHPNCSIHQISVEGIWIIVDNIFGEDQTIDEFGQRVSEYLNENYSGFQYRHKCFGDPAGTQASDKSKFSSERILNDMGFKVTSIPSNSKHSGYANRKAIIEKKLRTLISGIPSLVINDVPNNAIIAEAFEGGYRYPDANKYGGIVENPVEDGWYEHPMNTIEYVAVNLFKAIEQKQRPIGISQSTRSLNLKNEAFLNAGIGY